MLDPLVDRHGGDAMACTNSVPGVDLRDLQADRVCEPYGFANSGGLVFVDESAKEFASA